MDLKYPDDFINKIIILYCPFCGAKNEVMSEYTSDNTSGLIVCSNCGQLF